MLQGRRSNNDNSERQAAVVLNIKIPESMAIELRHRTKAQRTIDPNFSRNDLVRRIFLDYFKRNPVVANHG